MEKSNFLGTSNSYWIIPGTNIAGHPIEIINFVCHATGIEYADIVSKSQKREIVDARRIAIYFIYNKFIGKYSLKAIAKMFNFVSHATVIHCIKTAKSLKEANHSFRALFDMVEEKVNQ